MMRFEDLEVWKRAARLSANIYIQLKDLRDYGFKDQITRSGLSIPSNIAEGFERESQKENITFLSYAKGSCGELRCQTEWISSIFQKMLERNGSRKQPKFPLCSVASLKQKEAF